MKKLCNITCFSKQGQAAVEFVLSALVFLVLLVMFINFSVSFFRQAWLDFLAREASREAAVDVGNNPGNWVNDVKGFVNSRVGTGGMNANNLVVDVSMIDNNNQVQVTLDYDPDIHNPKDDHLKAKSTAYNESASGHS